MLMKLFSRWFSFGRSITLTEHVCITSSKSSLLRNNLFYRRRSLLRPSTFNFVRFNIVSREGLKTYAAIHNDLKPVYSKHIECTVSTHLSIRVPDADWSTHELYMVTCSEMWDEWPSGAQVIVGYIDTATMVSDEQRAKMPTALIIKSGFTDDIELKPMLDELINQGFRLIIPDMIGYGVTRGLTKTDEDCFSNLVGERSAFILDFANALGISRFNIGIGHKLGCDPVTVIGANFSIFDSIVLVSPVPKIRTLRLIHPEWLTHRMLYWSFNWLRYLPAWLWFTYRFRPSLVKFTKNNDFSFRRMQTILSTLHGVNFSSMASMATLLEARRIPLLYIYSEDDQLVDSPASAEYGELFGVSDPLTNRYNENGQLTNTDHLNYSDVTVQRARGIRLSSQSLNSELNRIIVEEIRMLIDSHRENH